MEKELGKKIQEGQRTSNRLDQKKQSSLQHITIRLSLDEHSEKILKYACDKSQLTYIGTPIRPTADLSEENPTIQKRITIQKRME